MLKIGKINRVGNKETVECLYLFDSYFVSILELNSIYNHRGTQFIYEAKRNIDTKLIVDMRSSKYDEFKKDLVDGCTYNLLLDHKTNISRENTSIFSYKEYFLHINEKGFPVIIE